MNKLLTLIAFCSYLGFAGTPYIPEVDNRFNVIEAVTSKDVINSGDGKFAMKYAVAEIDYSDISAATNVIVELNIPDNSIVTNCFYDVVTTFTSATDAATIGLQIQSSEDLKAPTAISSGTTWDAAGPKLLTPVWATVGSQIKLTAERDLTVLRSGSETLTAGKMVVYCSYFTGL